MTGEPHPQEHCGHECLGEVCRIYHMDLSIDYPPCDKECPHDTRTHSSSPAAGPVPEQPGKCPAYMCMFQNIDQECEFPCERIARQAAATERGRVIDDLIAWAQREYEVSGVIDTMDLRRHVESLRQNPEQQEQAGER